MPPAGMAAPQVVPVAPAAPPVNSAGAQRAPNTEVSKVIGSIPTPKRRRNPFSPNRELKVPVGGLDDESVQLDGHAKTSESPLGKIDSALRPLATAKAGDVVEVQIWLDRLPLDGLRKLRELGFQLAVELRTGKLLLGTLPASRLAELAKLPWVKRIEKPVLR